MYKPLVFPQEFNPAAVLAVQLVYDFYTLTRFETHQTNKVTVQVVTCL